MKAFTPHPNEPDMKKEDPRMMPARRGPGALIPPHERKALMRLECTEADWNLLLDVFEDEDTAMAALNIIQGAPPEIQILAVQLMNLTQEVA